MTREEAIEVIRQDIPCEHDADLIEALEMAIKALEQEPITDSVSKNDVIKMLNTMDRYVADKLRLCDTNKEFPSNEVFIVDDVYEGLDLLPPVTPTRPTCKDCK